MAPAEAAAAVSVELVFAESPRLIHHQALRLPAGSTVADALVASGWRERFGAGVDETLRVGVWGRTCALDAPLRERDRIELYRALVVDPKEARRQRYRRDGVRRAPR